MNDRRVAKPALGRRFLGVPWLWAVAHSAIAFSIYYSLGVVADHGLALTPVIFAVAGLVYMLTTMTYVEGGAMFSERGGSNTLARHAFNELVSFIAGWAILIDYVIVIALAAITVPHYLEPISDGLASGTGEEIVAVGGHRDRRRGSTSSASPAAAGRACWSRSRRLTWCSSSR